MKKKVVFALAVMLLMSVYSVGAAHFHETIGTLGEPGTIMIGELPATPDPDKPVLLFVQGLTNDSTAWYEGNDMYARAVVGGYETAFVELYDSGGEPRSYWDNGAMLANQIEQISSYYGGKDIVIIGYSKGGVDAQAALIHYGKHHLVRDVVTIGSPHYGSELADLAHSKWAGWLAALIGARSEGTESLQTGTMNHFRSITDSRWEAFENTYYTIAGDRAGPLFSSYFTGGLFIPGPSDGVVSVASAQLPYGHNLGIRHWNHGEVLQGQRSFPLFESILSSPLISKEGKATVEERDDVDVLIRGGEHEGEKVEIIPIEEDVREVTLDWISSEKLMSVTLEDPNNQVVKGSVTVSEGEGYFEGAWHHTITIDKPLSGEWSFSANSKGKSGYLLLASFDSPLNKQLDVKKGQGHNGWEISPAFTGALPYGAQPFNVSSFVEYSPALNKQGTKHSRRQKQSLEHRHHNNGKVPLPFLGEGSYNTTISIEGTTPNGQRFERTIIDSVYIDHSGKSY
ncbi:alpha/beta fold hydrolase [Alteribacter aurantiacus]|uniref:alpha/beta fold hydrolase n=1 Tax=Alteribacter aurantiacus TaxID=254410 RepID=UPI000415BDE4|nr:alpha/beta fold hydrolase [Alteribacter aurantiacus]